MTVQFRGTTAVGSDEIPLSAYYARAGNACSQNCFCGQSIGQELGSITTNTSAPSGTGSDGGGSGGCLNLIA